MYHTTSFRSMNTEVAAWLWSSDPAAARTGLRQVERAFGEAHTRFTRFDAASELSALNASAGRPFAASPELFEVVQSALRFGPRTGGLFDPAILDALEAAGYDRTFERVGRGEATRTESAPGRAPAETTLSAWLDAAHKTIALPAGVRLDLGGIAKGWTVQQAARRLSDYGPCLIDAGGDIAAMDAPPGESGWRVGVADPFDARHDIATLRLRDAAVATSSLSRRRWMRGGVAQHHLIDPRTGYPSGSDLFSVTLLAPTAVEAEVYAKTVFLHGAESGLSFVESRPTLAALLVTRTGGTLASSRLEHYLDVRFIYDSSELVAA